MGDSDEVPPRFEFDLPDAPCAVYLDRQLMRRVFINLISNAVGAARGRDAGVEIQISLRRRQRFFELLFDDDGPGVPPALRSQIFEPYVTTKDDGTGLGLAIVKKIVIEHKGHIEMLESPSGGARVRMLLPAEERPSLPPFSEVVQPKRLLSDPDRPGLGRTNDWQ
jgi:two-component system nitrogen regulation sensor histidine kinase NtrY